MAGLTPNSANFQRVGRVADQANHVLTHPEYEYWRPEWQKIRDVLAGQKEIKRKAQQYLKRMKGMDEEDYQIYLDRALFYNMSAQTLNGMIGQVFRRTPEIRGLPRALPGKTSPFKLALNKFAKDGTSHMGVAKTCISQQIAMGRFGILVDAPETMQEIPTSFTVGYACENILDWDVEDVDGQFIPTRILLREFIREDPRRLQDQGYPESQGVMGPPPKIGPVQTTRTKRAPPNMGAARILSQWNYRTIYRELLLEFHPNFPSFPRVYIQNVYRDDPTRTPIATAIPVIRGVPLTFIPFKFFGSQSNTADVEEPPINGIVDINISHYRSYAELEYGRTFTALPVYYAPGGRDEGASDYHIGPNTVWETPEGNPPGILEYEGEGLKALESALETKEQQIAAIGGRLMPGMSRSISESDNQSNLREANEQSLLLNVIQNCEDGFSDVVRWWLMFRDVPLSETIGLRYEINTDFLTASLGAREYRAIQMMYEEGLIDDSILYEFLRKAEIIPSSMSFEEYQVARKDPNNFVNNPDAQARQRGFATRQQEINKAETDRSLDIEEESLGIQHDQVAISAKAQAAQAKAALKPTERAPTPPKPGA